MEEELRPRLDLTELQRYLVASHAEIMLKLDVMRLCRQPHTQEFSAIDDRIRETLRLCAVANDLIDRSAPLPIELLEDRPSG